MDHPRWLQDSNPLGLLFREAYGAFREALAAQPAMSGTAADAVSLEVAHEAARRMSDTLGGLRLGPAWDGMARRHGPFDEQLEAFQYAFAVVVDETLLNEAWPGRAAWGDYLLERRLFKTRSGGERLLERIDAVLQTQARAQRDLAEVYLYCLTVGYAGRLRDQPGGAAELAARRAALFAFLYPDWPDMEAAEFALSEAPDEHLFRSPPAVRGLASRMRTYLIAAGLVAIPLAGSLAAWLALRPIVGDTLRQIAGQS